MAPFSGPTKSEVLQVLRGSSWRARLPMTLGVGAPSAVIRVEGETFRVRRLSMNRARERSERARRSAAGDTSWAPEMDWQFLEPGEVVIESESLAAFISAIEGYEPWPFGRDLVRERLAEQRRAEREAGPRFLAGVLRGEPRPELCVQLLQDDPPGQHVRDGLALLDPGKHAAFFADVANAVDSRAMPPQLRIIFALVETLAGERSPTMDSLLGGRLRDAVVADLGESHAWYPDAPISSVGTDRAPLEARHFFERGKLHFQLGRPDLASAHFKLGSRFVSGVPVEDPYLLHLLTYLWNESGDFAESSDWVRRFLASGARVPASTVVNASNALVGAGALKEARALCLDALAAGAGPDVNHALACVHALSGDRDDALEQVRVAKERGYAGLPGMATDPELASLAADPRFTAILEG